MQDLEIWKTYWAIEMVLLIRVISNDGEIQSQMQSAENSFSVWAVFTQRGNNKSFKQAYFGVASYVVFMLSSTYWQNPVDHLT